MFARASGNQENILGILSSGWLQRFKQRHSVGGGRLSRRASESNISDPLGRKFSVDAPDSHERDTRMSPVSPSGHLSPVSGSRSDEEAKREAADLDFADRSSQPTRDPKGSSLSGGTMSPFEPFSFSPDPSNGSFPPAPTVPLRLHGETAAEPHYRDKRSNTFPSLDVDFESRPLQSDSASKPTKIQLPARSTEASASAVEFSNHDAQRTVFNANAGVRSPPSLRRSGSSPSMTGGRSFGNPSTANGGLSGSSTETSPVSPSQDDVRRATNTLLSHLQSIGSSGQPFEPSEYQSFVQLTKKLQIHHNQAGRSSSIGGLSRIPEADTEMPSTIAPSQMTEAN